LQLDLSFFHVLFVRFILDPSSPGYVEPGEGVEEEEDSEDVDYEILSHKI
jgi:hypothetical protein